MRPLLRFLVVIAVAVAAPPAAADWDAVPIDGDYTQAVVAPTGPGSAVAVTSGPAANGLGVHHARIIRDGQAGPVQADLPGRAYFNMLSGDGSASHGAVVAWTATDALHVAEAGRDDDELQPVLALPASPGDYSYGRPRVAVGAHGDAAVLYLTRDRETRDEQVMAVVRPADEGWGEPEPVGPSNRSGDSYARSVAVSPDGTVVVGLVRDGRARVATRSPGGPFSLSEPIGEPLPEHSWESPRVGIDALGNVAVAWLEGAPINDTGPVRVAFRPHGADRFSAPQDTGLEATGLARITMGVSALGEVVLVLESARSNRSYDVVTLQGIAAVFGSTILGRLGEPRTIAPDGDYPSVDVNDRGDAVAVWDECCPLALRARRRPVLGSFGPPVDVAPPIEFEGTRSGRLALDADVDDRGNARTVWVDGEPDPPAFFVGSDGPSLLDLLPDPGPLGDLIAPVLPLDPTPDPEPSPTADPDPPHVPAPDLPLPFRASVASPKHPQRLAGDRVAPKVTVSRARYHRRRLSLRMRSSERAVLRLRVQRTGRPAQVVLRAGRRQRVRLPLRRLRHRSVRLRGVATDAAGNVRTIRRTVRVRF